MIIDSFDQGGFNLSAAGTSSSSASVNTPAGTGRAASISSRLASQGTTLTSTLSTANGTLSFSASGTSINSVPLNFYISYFGGGSHDISAENSFQFDFSSLHGVGAVVIELGALGPDDGTKLKFTLDQSGPVTVPFSYLLVGSEAAINDFSQLNFTFEAISADFSFTLNEIRVVPESSSCLVGVYGLIIFWKRRRDSGVKIKSSVCKAGRSILRGREKGIYPGRIRGALRP